MATIDIKTMPHGTIALPVNFEVIDRGENTPINRYDWRAWYNNSKGEREYIESEVYSQSVDEALDSLRKHFNVEEG